MKRPHFFCLLGIAGLLCLVATTQFLINSFLSSTNDSISLSTNPALQLPLLPPDNAESLDISIQRLHKAAKQAANANARPHHYTGLDTKHRLRELENQVADWSSLLASAKDALDVQSKTSKTNIKTLKERLRRLKQQVGHDKKVNLLHQLALGALAPTSMQAASSAATTTIEETSSMFIDHTVGSSAGALPSLKIYVYDMPAAFNYDLAKAEPNCMYNSGYSWQTKYTLETYMHAMLLKSSLRTMDPEEANLFYVPIYVGCYLHRIGTNFFKASEKIMNGVEWIQKHHPYWEMSQGRDHIFTFTHDIGGCVAPFRALKNAIFITNTGELHDRSQAYATYTNMYAQNYYKTRDLTLPCFNPWKDIVAPPMINDQDMMQWHERSRVDKNLKLKRTHLATFRGTIIDKPGGWHHYSRSIRQHWLKKYEFDENIKITAVHPKEGFGNKAANYQQTYRTDFLTSTYCLCPPGWATWTPRLYEALLLGCIPAVIADDNVLPFARTLDYTQFAVHVPEKDANDLENLLPTNEKRILELQQGVSKVYRAFIYNDPPIQGDAFHYLMKELEWRAKSLGVMQGFVKE